LPPRLLSISQFSNASELGGRVAHRLLLDRLVSDDVDLLGNELLSLLVELDKIAAVAAPGLEEVADKVAGQLRVAPLADVVTAEEIADAVDAKAGGNPPSETRRVDDAVALEVGVLVEPVVRLAESDARAAAGDQAGVGRAEALEEARVPRTVARRVLDLVEVSGGVVGLADPVVDVLLHLRLLGRRAGGDGSRGRISGRRRSSSVVSHV